MTSKACPAKPIHFDNLESAFHEFMKTAGTAAVCVGLALNPAQATSNFQKIDPTTLSQNAPDPNKIIWVMGSNATATLGHGLDAHPMRATAENTKVKFGNISMLST